MTVTRKKSKLLPDGTRVVEVIELTGDELIAYNAALNAPKVKRREGEFREFLSLFTETEQIAVQTAALGNASLALWLNRAVGGATMSLDHPDTEAGLSNLVAAGLITSERKSVILASDFDLV